MKRFNTISKGELKKYDKKKCRIETDNWYICEWEIYIEDDRVFVLHNNSETDWTRPKEMKGYEYSRLLYRKIENNETSDNLSYKRIDIDTEEFVRWEEVLVRDNEEEDWKKRIYLTTIDWANTPFVCVSRWYKEEFKEWKPFDFIAWKHIKKIETKKEYSMNEIASSLGIDVKDLIIKKD